MKIRIQVIKVYDVEVPDDCEDPTEFAYGLQSTEIAKNGELVDVTTGYVESPTDL